MARTRTTTPATVEGVLRLGTGFGAAERDRVVRQLTRLGSRLRTFPAEGTDLVLTVKDRDTRAQRLVLECRLPHRPSLVATSGAPDLRTALVEVRDELIHQLGEAKTRLDRARPARRGRRGRSRTP